MNTVVEVKEELLVPSGKKYYEYIKTLDIIPPKSGKAYSRKFKRFTVKDNESVPLTEKQANIAKLLADTPSLPLPEAYIRAGYKYENFFNEGKGVKKIKAYLTSQCRRVLSPNLTRVMNHWKSHAADALQIDAKWLLNEQVGLYEECRREKQYTQAVRLLDSIATHVDVDAKVSNRLEITDKVDYAALLNDADSRLKVIEGEVEVDKLPVLSEENIPSRAV